ncbi:hypothetical protein GYA37_01400 [candidate division WWE3 bacterium]|uniref:Uncharacterized protein n=1 Tax=candidate division WWE3 bacterium TaxID=2053526 RepID=A0A7X9E6N3_UNCKA|nr:hypothetical protein [candidate division WWE3 bacterium]
MKNKLAEIKNFITNLIKGKAFRVVIITIMLVGITCIVSYYAFRAYKTYNKSYNETNNSINEHIQDLQNRITRLEQSNTDLVKTKDEFQNKLWACLTYVRMYQIFYEKADEMFANGISGCAIKYINSGNPKKLPDGCYRWRSAKEKQPNSRDTYYQNPDQEYYNSLKSLYYQMLKFQELCNQ